MQSLVVSVHALKWGHQDVRGRSATVLMVQTKDQMLGRALVRAALRFEA